MNSLHDLIYGQEEQQQEAPPSDGQEEKKLLSQKLLPSRKRSFKEDIDHESNEQLITSDQQQQTTTTAAPSIVQRMNVLYGQTTTASATNNELQDLQTSLNPPVVQSTRKARKQSTMTAERRAKQERKREWNHIRQQWKRRQINYRNEIDVGGVLQQVFLKSNTESKQENKKEEQPQRSPKHQIEIVDTSDEEEEAILRQLTQGNGEAERTKKRKQEEEEEAKKKNDVFISYREKMNYYNRGLVRPDDMDPLRQYENQKRAAAQQLSKSNAHYSTKHPGEAITLRRIRVVNRLNPQESTFPPLDHNMYSSPHFAHKRQVLRLAARCLLARAHCTDFHANLVASRLLRYLWNSDVLDASNSSLIRHLARETATRHEMFWSHIWKNRDQIAKVLGVTKEMQLAGPYVGYRLDAIGAASKRKQMLKLKKAQSRGSISTGAKKVNQRRTSAAQKRAIDLGPIVSYAFIPGTIPPIPHHPLDESGVVLGPPDKFCNYITSKVVIDEPTWKLTSAHLLAIFAANIKSNTSTEDICVQIQNMCKKAIDLNRKVTTFASMSTAEDDWPLPHVYRSWMGYLSLILNGVLCMSEHSHPNQDSNFMIECGQRIAYPSFDESMIPYSSVREAAAEFFDVYQQVDQTIGLERFGDYHLVNGLLRIAKDLPESAARLMAQPLDAKSDMMPFELMHSILVHLDQNGMLTEKPSRSSSTSISVIELEYAIFQASQIFLKCVERDPTELKFHCWHLASLASSLVLCSGNRIGSGAFLEPSSGQDSSCHTVRQALPKFQETRRDTARALYLLFELASKQSEQNHIALSSEVHLAVTKFLEWHPVVALLIGPCNWKEKIQALETIHKHHSKIWALSFVDTCQDLSTTANDHSIRIEAAARALEQDPSCKRNWRALALELGPVGCRASPSDLKSERFCVKKECFDCWMLVQDYFIDHEKEKRNGESIEWWGRNRKQWWQHCVLDLKNPTQYDVGLVIHRTQFHKCIELDLSSIEVQQPVTRHVEKVIDAATLNGFYGRLTEVDRVQQEQDYVISGPVDQYLPKSSRETYSQEEEENEETTSFLEFACSSVGDGTDHDILEVECYQIIIASHLYGPGNPWVQSKVLQIATKSWDRKNLSIRKDSAEWAALKWLHERGISAANALKIAIKIHGRKKPPS